MSTGQPKHNTKKKGSGDKTPPACGQSSSPKLPIKADNSTQGNKKTEIEKKSSQPSTQQQQQKQTEEQKHKTTIDVNNSETKNRQGKNETRVQDESKKEPGKNETSKQEVETPNKIENREEEKSDPKDGNKVDKDERKKTKEDGKNGDKEGNNDDQGKNGSQKPEVNKTKQDVKEPQRGSEDTSGSNAVNSTDNTINTFVIPEGYTFVKTDQYKQLQEDYRNQQESIEELTSRLSAIASNKLKEGNPNIADLSDKNRPTKLAELFAGMYDDEWSEALEAMRGGKEENEEEDLKVIEKLLKIVKDSYQFCGEYADRQLQTLAMHMKDVVTSRTKDRSPDPKSTTQEKEPRSETEQSSTSEGDLATVPDTQDQTTTKSKPNSDNLKEKKEEKAPQKKGESSPEERMLKDTWHIALRFAKSFRKETAMIAIADIKEEFKTIYMKENKIDSLLPELSKYIERCVELIWLMAVQDPPMSLRWANKGDKSDSNFFKFFMSKGRYVKMCAWPAVFLCENGAIVSKGYIVGENPPPPKENEKKTKNR